MRFKVFVDVMELGSFAAVARLRDVDPSSISRSISGLERDLGACTSFGQRVLAPLLPKFFKAFPSLTLDLILVDHHVDLVADQIDLAIRFGSKPDRDVVALRLAPRRFKVCASPGYVEAAGAPEHPHDLESVDCLLFSFPGYRSRWLFKRPGEAPIAVPVHGRLLVSHGLTMTACAVEGLGPALLYTRLRRRISGRRLGWFTRAAAMSR
jgi:DNA-binding transcriptional LysR family regulator